jgi:hypothetical protein
LSNTRKTEKFEQIGKDLANIDKSVLDLLEKYESRLQALESIVLRAGLCLSLRKINQISDVYKRNVAAACFIELIDALGIKDLGTS